MIELITGRSGSGKSELLYRYIREKCADKAILIVPEQSSFYNEKKLIDDLGDKIAGRIEVLSFRRLCSNIMEEHKADAGKRIDDGVKAVLMSMAIEKAPSEGGELELYTKKGKKGLKKTMDLVDPMLIAVNEYKMCLISPEQLFTAAKRVDSVLLSSKLRDSARIYAAYNALLENTYEDPDDDLVRLYDILCEYDHFSGMNVFIDSFYGFSAQELKVIERIVTQADNVYITVCCDRNVISDSTTIFDEPVKTYREILHMAQKRSVPCHITDLSDEGRRFKTESLRAVENGIFKGYRGGLLTDQIKNDGSVRMYEAEDIYDEISHAAKEIFRLVHEKGYKYNEIELIARNLDEYGSVIRSEFPKYNIPFFLSESECLDNKAFVRMILSVFDAVHGNYDTEAILRIAKSGFAPVSEDEAFELENYTYIWSIRGRRWLEPFTMSPDGLAEKKDDDAESSDRLKKLEDVRQRLIMPLTEFEKSVYESENGGQITYAVYRMIEKYDCQRSFRRYIYSVRAERDDLQAEREAGVWDKVMAVLDKMYELMKEKKTDSRSYLELLRLYLKKTPVSDIPETINSVTIGIAGTIRSAAPRAVLSIGCNEGVFPAQPSAAGIFTDSERRLLREECGEDERLPLYDSIFGNSLKEKFNVYTALSAPSEMLFISWYLQNLSGKASSPSVIRNEILEIMPDTVIERKKPVSESSSEELFFTKRQSFDLCAQLWHKDDEAGETLKKYYTDSDEYGARTKAIMRSAEKEAFALKDQDRIRRLFGSPLRLSSTKLDQFASCKFAYFCRYGLGAYPVRKAGMDGSLYGTAMHYIFENTLKERTVEEFVSMNEDELKKTISLHLENYLQSIGKEDERTGRFNSICGRIRRNGFKTLENMQRQFRKDSFRPVDFELRIGDSDGDEESIPAYEIGLPTGDRLIVTGYVDRVDAASDGDNKYLRIIDYKTGNTDFSLSKVANGIKIQMLLYLSAILKNGRKKYSDGKVMLPAGVLYVPATSRSKAAVSGSDAALKASELEQKKNFKMKGILLNDEKVLRMMEDDLAGEFIPANMTAKKTLSTRSSVISAESFDMIFNYIDTCLKSMGTELYMGNIEAFPEEHACDYCDYPSVCRHEDGDVTRKLMRLSDKQALEIIGGDEKKGESEDGN